jgi:hypothetical protein
MSNVYKFPIKNTNAHRMFCDNCLCILEYWLGDDDSAYGMCPRCNLSSPDVVQVEPGEDE